MVDDLEKLSKRAMRIEEGLLTNFALRPLVTTHHASGAVGHHSVAPHEVCADRSARLHRLQAQVLAHAFWDVINILAAFDSLLGQKLDLSTSTRVS